MIKSLFRRNSGPRGTRVFFATDVHGSEDCFRKFLAAPAFYDADVLVMGGDIIGKSLIPITKVGATYSVTFRDRELSDLSQDGLSEVQQVIRRGGDYYVIGTRDELAALSDPDELDRVFRKVVYGSMERWVSRAEEKLKGTGVKLFVAPGNDDFLEIDEALKGGEHVLFAEGQVLALDETHEVLTTGYSNITPWATERELDEEDMGELLERMALEVRHMSAAVAVIHPPPFDSSLDMCPAIDEDFRVQTQGGAVTLAPVGSTAVREFIERHQPLLGLHGHVHEGKGTVRIGRTLCLNPGSEYTDGILAGALIALGDDEVLSHQFVSG
ncbi:MAG: metallophosphoesterase [Actinobacteria bacterium]|nr:metallophosphoesterase [Actinomycetota bacterium]